MSHVFTLASHFDADASAARHGGGGGAGKASFQDLHLATTVGRATPGGGTVADDVIVDGPIITAEDPAAAGGRGGLFVAVGDIDAAQHELGHLLGFRHEHVQASGARVGESFTLNFEKVKVERAEETWLRELTAADAADASSGGMQALLLDGSVRHVDTTDLF
ncbi:MAG: hypothetical protein K2X74_04915 [Acetobacteraceae bacterium]|nr:hypothetical protein [Acetobacteraceae bacterium]